MIISALAFYLFAAIAIAAGFLVIASRNPVHSVFFLILAFFSSAGLFVLQGAEFVAMILVIVYVGAVAVLFLFVVMMLDINFTELRQGFQQYLPIGATVGLIMLVELVLILVSWNLSRDVRPVLQAPAPPISQVSNTHALGDILYTQYAYLFQIAGLILLVAMIGAIVLTLRRRTGVRRQSVAAQIDRRREDAVVLAKVKSGQGV